MTQIHEDFPEKELTREIIAAFYRVYNTLGYGFLESVYQRALAHELTKRGIHVDREYVSDVYYDGIRVGHFKSDLVAERKVDIETKACEHLIAADRKKLMNYLRSTKLEVGLLLHFGPKPAHYRVVYSNRFKPWLKEP
ncbi:MAG: GxxExxY protein [Gemmatimonadaceae bacterium]